MIEEIAFAFLHMIIPQWFKSKDCLRTLSGGQSLSAYLWIVGRLIALSASDTAITNALDIYWVDQKVCLDFP